MPAAEEKTSDSDIQFDVRVLRLAVASSDEKAVSQRMMEAENLKEKFISCAELPKEAKLVSDASVRSVEKAKIASFPKDIQPLILKASEGQMTPPVLVNGAIESYAICKRMIAAKAAKAPAEQKPDVRQEEYDRFSRSYLQAVEALGVDRLPREVSLVNTVRSGIVSPSRPQTLGKPIAVTMGDPAGIGLDIALLAWLKRSALDIPPFFVCADPMALIDRAGLLEEGGDVCIEAIERPPQASAAFANALPVLPLSAPLGPVIAGSPRPDHASAIIASIEEAVALTVAGQASAVVTNPIAKYVLLEAGFAHAGHTEFLRELAGRHGYDNVFPVMMMASRRLNAVPVTVHMALKDVPPAITRERIVNAASITSAALSSHFAIPSPRLAVCGLNPHAGENGAFGREEIEIIAPAIEALNARGIRASGPHPADTLFHDAARETYDAVLAMYHDQALIPFKTLSFDDGVNVTLGLPFIRTSPDHGTAFQIAGTGHANPSSFIEALRLAREMARNAAAASSGGTGL